MRDGGTRFGDIRRNRDPVRVTIDDDADLASLGLEVDVPATAVAVPTARSDQPAIGLLLAVIDPGTDEDTDRRIEQVTAQIEPLAPPAAVLIERLTIAGRSAIMS